MRYSIAPAYRPRFVPAALIPELLELWHTARTALCAKGTPSSYDKKLWASREFSKAHPEISVTAAYKDIDGLIHP